ncbi:membrane protein [Georgenia halophila]|uniref:Membrane protein n=1 Tax=Georgenia halophila TaxID=620889 RepID=A0ABP8LQK2_9MICO
MGVTEWVLLAVLVIVVAVVLLWRRAVRLDVLHRTVLRSRATLEAQLVRRASAAYELAASGALDPAEALLVTDVALRASDASGAELVPDGLAGPEGTGPLDEAALTGDGPRPASAQETGEPVDRGLVESELSRTLRAVLGEPEEQAVLAADPRAADIVSRLHQSWYRLQLARRFHNSHVEQVRSLRSDAVVRVFHLAGRAPVPEPFDMDDALPPR